MEADLLALAVEVASVTASGRQLREPIKVPRPGEQRQGGMQRPRTAEEVDAAYRKGIAVLAATRRSG